MSWGDFEKAAPELAAFGAERLHGRVSYLATTQKNGAPRVHPVTPVIGQGHFFVFMESTSPKGKDLLREGRYAIHCAVGDDSGASGEVWCAGRAKQIQDPNVRALAAQLATYTPADRYILFEFDVERAQSTVYPDDEPMREIWKRNAT